MEIIYPTNHIMLVEINLEDYTKFKKIWSSKKVYDFYCLDKRVDNKNLILSVRAMRINEFIKILTDFNIPCKIKEQL